MNKVFSVLQMYRAKSSLAKEKENVVLKLNPQPSRWVQFKNRLHKDFYTCFYRSEPHERPLDRLKQIWYDGTEPNDHMKLLLGYIGAGLLFTLMCTFFVFKYPWSPRTVGLISGIVAMIFSYAMFFPRPRCWFLLMIPEFFCNRSRAILILLALSWTMVGPATNAQVNLGATVQMIGCIQEQVSKEGQSLKSMAENSLHSRFESFYIAKQKIEKSVKRATDSLKTMYNSFVRISKCIIKFQQWLNSMVQFCNRSAIEPYTWCSFWLQTARDHCRNAVGLTGFIFSFCWILDIFKYLGCYWLLIFTELCKIPKIIVEFIQTQILERIKQSLDNAIQRIEGAFAFEVVIDRNVSYFEKFDSNMSMFRDEMQRQMDNVQEYMQTISYILEAFIWISFFWMFIKSICYQRTYLSNPKKDNYFLTEELEEADKHRMTLNKETALPLPMSQRNDYISAWSIWMTRAEIWKMIRPFFNTTATFIFVGFWINFDVFIWSSMQQQYVMLMEAGGVDVPNYYKLHIQGEGMIADAYRALLHTFIPQNFDDEDLTKKWQLCIVEPTVPDFKLHENLYMMLCICYVTVIFKVYLSRFRHGICFLFWPDQEKKRAVELQNSILITRGSWAYFAQKQLGNRKNAKTGMADVALQRMAVSMPLLGKLVKMIGDELKLCFECNEHVKLNDLENYRSCENCSETFCSDCFYKTPTCQSCGGDKVPKGLFIDYEIPKPKPKEKKSNTELGNEDFLLKLYGGPQIAQENREEEEVIQVSVVSVPPERTLPGTSSDMRYNLPPRSAKSRRPPRSRKTSRSPRGFRSAKASPRRGPSPIKGRPPRRLSRSPSPSRKRSVSPKRSKRTKGVKVSI